VSSSHIVSPAPVLAGTFVSMAPTAFTAELPALRASQPGSCQPSHAARSLTGQQLQPNLFALDDAFAALAAGHLFLAGRLSR
jgi:hypothetical protein